MKANRERLYKFFVESGQTQRAAEYAVRFPDLKQATKPVSKPSNSK